MDKIVHHPFWKTNGLLVGRVLLGLLFLAAGVMKLQGGVDGTVDMITEGTDLPFPVMLAWLAIAIEIVGGAMLIVGYKTMHAALGLAVFTLVVTALFHLSVTDGNLMKNLAIVGGLLYVVAYGAGNAWTIKRMG